MVVVSPFTHDVGDLISHRLVATSADVSIADAAQRMAREDTGSVVAVDERGIPIGIVTDSDLRRKVVAAGHSPTEPLRSIMSTPVVTVGLDLP